MDKRNIKKILIVLIVLIVYVNYNNYFKPDIKKLYLEKQSIERMINRELKIQDGNYTSEKLSLDNVNIMFNGKDYTYSSAMGEMQNHINKAAKGICNIKSIKWAQVPNSEKWYDRLKMDVRLTCMPNEFLKFTNNVKNDNLLYIIDNFRGSKDTKKSYLNISFQLIGFRLHNEIK